MLKNCNDNKKTFKKCNVLLNISTGFFIFGFVFLFIRAVIGVLLIVLAGIINLYLTKKYPEFMNEIKKEQKKSLANNARDKKINIVHIQGIKFIDFGEKIKCLISNKSISFFKNEQNILTLDVDKIENALILEEIEHEQKNKSVIARTIVGGLFLGPVGAIVGGVSGACPTFKANKKYFLEITINEQEKIIFTTNNNDLKKIKEQILNQIKA